MFRLIFALALVPVFFIQAQTSTETLQLEYQDSEANNQIKQARFKVSLKSQNNDPLSLKGKTVILFKNQSCSGDRIYKQENVSYDVLNFPIEKKYFEANKTYNLSAGTIIKSDSKSGFILTNCSAKLDFQTNAYTALKDPIRIENIEPDNPGAPSIRLWNMTKSNEKIFVYLSDDCTGEELIKKTVSINNLKASKDVHLSREDFLQIQTYTLSVKTDVSTCSNPIQYKKVPIDPPKFNFYLISSNKGKSSQVKFYFMNLKKKDELTIYQNDPSCSLVGNQITKIKAPDNAFYVNANLFMGESSPDATYEFYAQASRGGTYGQCIGPLLYTLKKQPPIPPTLELLGNKISPVRTPQFKISNLELGTSAELILGSNCFGKSMARMNNGSNNFITFGVAQQDFLSTNKTYVFSGKVTDQMGNSSCSNNLDYTLVTEIPDPTIKILSTSETIAKTLANPTFRVEKVAIGDKVTIYKDKYCGKLNSYKEDPKVSEEKTIGPNQSYVDIQINSLVKAEKNIFYAKVFSNIVQDSRCSSGGVFYEYQPAPPTTPTVDSSTVDQGGNTNNGTTPVTTDTRVSSENDRIINLGLYLETTPISDFYVTQLGYNELEVFYNTDAITQSIDNMPEVDKPSLSTNLDQLVPYVKTKDKPYLSIGAVSVNKILSNLKIEAPNKYTNLRNYSRIVRDYTESPGLNFKSEEIEKNMSSSGFVWLHDFKSADNIITYKTPILDTSKKNYADQVTGAIKNLTDNCALSENETFTNTQDNNYYCIKSFNPSKLYTTTYSNAVRKLDQLESDPYLSIVYFLKNGLDPVDFGKNTTLIPFALFGLSSFPSDKNQLEMNIKNYVGNILTKPNYMFQDNKWALYIKYRLQRDFSITYSSLKSSFDNYKKIEVDPGLLLKREFVKNVCRAHSSIRDPYTRELFQKNNSLLPGYYWKTLGDTPAMPEWCKTYGDDLMVPFQNFTLFQPGIS